MPRCIQRRRRMSIGDQTAHFCLVLRARKKSRAQWHLLLTHVRYAHLRPSVPACPGPRAGRAWASAEHGRLSECKLEATQDDWHATICTDDRGDRDAVSGAEAGSAALDGEPYVVLDSGARLGLRIDGPCRMQLMLVDGDHHHLRHDGRLASSEEAPVAQARYGSKGIKRGHDDALLAECTCSCNEFVADAS